MSEELDAAYAKGREDERRDIVKAARWLGAAFNSTVLLEFADSVESAGAHLESIPLTPPSERHD
jgi:hypothetical protein